MVQKTIQQQIEELTLEGLRRGVVTPLGFSSKEIQREQREEQYCVYIDQHFFEQREKYDSRCTAFEQFCDTHNFPYTFGGRRNHFFLEQRNYVVNVNEAQKNDLNQADLVQRIELIKK